MASLPILPASDGMLTIGEYLAQTPAQDQYSITQQMGERAGDPTEILQRIFDGFVQWGQMMIDGVDQIITNTSKTVDILSDISTMFKDMYENMIGKQFADDAASDRANSMFDPMRGTERGNDSAGTPLNVGGILSVAGLLALLNFDELVEQVTAAWSAFKGKVGDAFKSFFEKVSNFIKKTFNLIPDNIKSVIIDTADKLKSVADGVRKFFIALVPTGLLDMFTKTIPQSDEAATLMKKLKGVAAMVIKGGLKKLPIIGWVLILGEAIWDMFKEYQKDDKTSTFMKTLKVVWAGVNSIIEDVIFGVLELGKSILSTIVGWMGFDELEKKLDEFDLTKTIYGGLKEWIEDVFKRVFKFLKDHFPIIGSLIPDSWVKGAKETPTGETARDNSVGATVQSMEIPQADLERVAKADVDKRAVDRQVTVNNRRAARINDLLSNPEWNKNPRTAAAAARAARKQLKKVVPVDNVTNPDQYFDEEAAFMGDLGIENNMTVPMPRATLSKGLNNATEEAQRKGIVGDRTGGGGGAVAIGGDTNTSTTNNVVNNNTHTYQPANPHPPIRSLSRNEKQGL